MLRHRTLLIRVLFVLALLPCALTFGYMTLRLAKGPHTVFGPLPGLRRWDWQERGPWWPPLDFHALLPTLDRRRFMTGNSPLEVWTRLVWRIDSTLPLDADVGYVGPWGDWGPIAQYYLYPRRVVMFSFPKLDASATPRMRDQWRQASPESLKAWLAEHPKAWVLTAEASLVKDWIRDRATLVAHDGDCALFRSRAPEPQE